MLKVSFDLETPYRPRDKCWVQAAITGAAALGSAALGLASQGGANKKNVQMNRETNEMNRQINQESYDYQMRMQNMQNAWNLAQWNRENEYNSPAAQVQRVREAGLNPYFESGVGTGEASSLQSSAASLPAMQAMQAGEVKPLDFSGVTSGVQAFMQNQLLQTQIDRGAADARIAEANARVQSLRNAHDLLKIANDASKSEYERDMARSVLNVQKATEQNQIYHSSLLNDISQQQVYELQEKISGQNIQNKIAAIDSHYRARMNAAQLRSYQANINQAFAAARAHDASAAASYAAAAVSDAQATGIRIDNETKKEYNKAILDAAWTEAEQANDNRLFNILDKNFQYQGKVGNYFPMQSGQFSAADRYQDWYRKNRGRGFKGK